LPLVAEDLFLVEGEEALRPDRETGDLLWLGGDKEKKKRLHVTAQKGYQNENNA
jgi:hypothetical protein